jgi:3-oxoadipate enol-lactonase
MTEHFTETSPRLAYVERGEVGPPVLLIMGFGMRKELWEPQLAGLSGSHRVVAFDNRGVGSSERGPSRLFTMPMMADDACRVLDAASLPCAHVVGVSMGGMIAQELAFRHPSRLLSLSLIATHPGSPRYFIPPPEGIRLFPQTFYGDAASRMATTRALLYPPEYVALAGEEKLGARMRAMMGAATPNDVLLAQLAAIMRHWTIPRLRTLDVPTLVVRPGKDVLVRATGSDAIAKAIPGARLSRYDDAGHGLIFQCADRLNAELAAHFAEAEARRSPPARARAM